MKLIHTADLHLGQTIYQHYERADEHAHFFAQLEKWCVAEKPDALVVSGDVFDGPQPSAAVKKDFNAHFVRLHELCPEMRIVVTAGNHDSPSRLEADRELWALADARVAGTPPPFADVSDTEDWRERFIVRLKNGYVVALPHMNGARTAQIQSILDKIAAENADGKPVVMTAHLALAGSDTTGHDEIGGIRTVPATELGEGYDYLALGHIHRPQTLGATPDVPGARVELPAPVRRYSGSALHVSCDEAFPHSASLVEIDRHGGTVAVTPLRIDELRHFHVLPESGEAFADAKSAVAAVKRFAEEKKSGYFRLRVRHDANLPADFSQRIYEAVAPFGGEIRFNPKHVVEGAPAAESSSAEKPVFAVADLQQMTDPLEFIEKTIADYPELNIDEVRELFEDVCVEARRLADEAAKKAAEEAARKKKSRGTAAENDDEDADDENA
ncbi:MAG: exonuclease SbcCD subunit D [Candidatus Spyradosoma sp.]